MLNNIIQNANINTSAVILLELAIILMGGFLFTRITKLLKLPNVTAYIICGILIGPYVLGLISKNFIDSTSFVSDIALAFIAFGVGKFFKMDVLRKAGFKIIIITLFESLLAGLLIFILMFSVFHLSLSFSLILAAIATATAPASTMMTIKQFKAKGDFVETLLQVVALDDVICLLAFSICIAVGQSLEASTVTISSIILPLVYNLGFLIIGFLFGLVLSFLISTKRSRDSRLIITVSMLLLLSGLCIIFDVSPLLCCMVFGTTYINLSKDERVFNEVDKFSPPIMCLFFVRSGMSLDLTVLGSVGIIGLTYFIVRIVGKLLGSFIGCAIVRKPKSTRNYLGLALIPQAGVAIGLGFMGQRLLPTDTGNLLLTIILASSVLYELIGPVCAKLSLFLSHSIPKEETEPLDSTIKLELSVKKSK